MQRSEWISLFSSCPVGRLRLRPGASRQRLWMLERQLGRRLPGSYRSLLRAGDGGVLGSTRFFGTHEICRWLRSDRRTQRPRAASQGARRAAGTVCLRESPRKLSSSRFVPLAPLGREAIEWLDLGCGGISVFERGQRPSSAEAVMLYRDIDDWALDALWDLHFESGDLSLSV